MNMQKRGSALVTGGARRIGEAIVRALHAEGYRVLVHCHRSRDDGDMLVRGLNATRPSSAVLLTGDLAQPDDLESLIAETRELAPDLALLVNNASAFMPTPVATTTAAQWDTLVQANLRAPFLLIRGLAPLLASNFGNVVNLLDIHAERPLKDHAVYSMTKAGLASLTRSLALDLAPGVRVNGVSPGAILWPEGSSEAHRQKLLAKIPLQRAGEPDDIAQAVVFLATRAGYMTGQIIAVDGGRTLNQ
ncbi:MAG: pteridine reductase [Pseudomonadota bacterium]